MAKPLAFTQANVKALHYTRTDGQPQFTWDTDQIGLGVRITASGVKSFVLRYRVLDRQRLKTLGKTANHSVDAARIWARAGLSAADRNEDFQAAEQQQRALGTMAQLWRRYIDEHAKVHGAERTPRDLEGPVEDAPWKKPSAPGALPRSRQPMCARGIGEPRNGALWLRKVSAVPRGRELSAAHTSLIARCRR